MMLHCRTCNTIVHPKARMCSKCGFPPLLGYLHCQNCGADTKEGQVGCLSCGNALQSHAPPRPDDARAVNETLKRHCRNCGHQATSNADVCGKCGFPPRKMDKYCQSCAAETKSGQLICTSCGIQLVTEKGQDVSSQSTDDSLVKTKSRLTAGLLAMFLGPLGVHKFYLGYTTPAMIMLFSTLHMSATFVTLVASVIAPIFLLPVQVMVWILGFVEGIRYLAKSDQEFTETYVINKREWF